MRDPRDSGLMPIGRFARGCQLTVKALRHYEDVGLLRPAWIDPGTGYRYYGTDQARRATAIALLRSLDVPLAAIERILSSDPEEMRRTLELERERLSGQIARSQLALQAIDRILREGDVMPYEVSVQREPPRRLAGLSGVTTVERVVRDTTRLMEQLFAGLRESGVSWQPPCLGLYPAELEGVFAVTVAVAAEAAPQLEEIDLPGGPMASITHVGQYEELPLAYHALFAWAQERGHRIGFPAREVYLNDPAETDPASLATQVLMPISPSEG